MDDDEGFFDADAHENRRRRPYVPLPLPVFDDSAPQAWADQTCQRCRQWQKDAVGDGSGVGACRINAQSGRLKWPGTTACRQFEGEGEG